MAHDHAPGPSKKLTTDQLHGKLMGVKFREHPVHLESQDGRYKATLWQRQTPAGALPGNDTVMTVEINGDVELFRWSSGIFPIEQVLSGKVPPA